MKMAITGVGGMLGSELERCAKAAGHEVLGYDLPELDISLNFAPNVIDGSCDVLVNCAAYTNVDGAESNRDLAYAVNDDGAGRLARWCSNSGTRMVHISTDYVFDGECSEPYSEESEVCPISVYGESKLAGEIAVLDGQRQALIIRTQALFGPGGKCFPSAIIGKLDEGVAALKVVNDQTVSPTCTGHLAGAILDLLKTDASHLFHVSSSGSCTWHAFASEIAALIKPEVAVEPVSTDAFPLPAKRPANSVLATGKFESVTGGTMPDWREALSWYLEVEGRWKRC